MARITFIGAGSFGFTRGLVRDILTFPLLAYTVYYWSRERFGVPKNHFAVVKVSSGEQVHTELYGPGYHWLSFYHSLEKVISFSELTSTGRFESATGDLQIALVQQGTIQHYVYNGQNVILPPGLHVIRNPLTFIKTHDLKSFFIEIGPEKWVTIPTGYDGVASNNGKLEILKGGDVYHLDHAKYKFLKLVPTQVQSDFVPSDVHKYLTALKSNRPLEADSKLLKANTRDGATISIDAKVFWQITDTEKAAIKCSIVWIENSLVPIVIAFFK